MAGEYVGFAFQGPYVDVVDFHDSGDVLEVGFYFLEVDVFGDALHEDVYCFFEVFCYVENDENC